MASDHDRTVRMLEARLEGLACVGERSPALNRSFDVHVTAVAAATRRAVDLRLLTAEEAGAVWAAVAKRHPASEWCRGYPLVA